MATDLERLVVQLSADMKQYQRGLQNAMGVTNRQARAIEARWAKSEKNLNALGANMARGLIAPLTGIAAALTVREVLSYADAWTKAKNSLAVAGVSGAQQTAVLDRLYQSAQANSAPIGALADLFGKAAQAADNLGASNDDLITFTDGVATALRVAGTGAGAASGALTQLGQLLGSARVQAEEFNSVNEGARPILIAVANGLDAAGGSVNKLKQLVNDGKLSGQQFFQAFLKGLPTIQAAAANSTQTIEQGVTKVVNAFTKYIGQTDESLGATQRLVAGLNALADNFSETADIVVQLASIIAGALVGRSIAGMIAKLGVATTAVQAFVVAIRNAVKVGSIATLISGISAAAGPIGLIVGGTAVAALTLFSSSAGKASAGAQTYAQALRQVEAAAKASADAVNKTTTSINAQAVNQISAGIKEGERDIAAARAEAVKLFSTILENAPRRIISSEQLASLSELRDRLSTGKATADEAKSALFALANSDPKMQRLADQLAPLLDRLAKAIAATGNLKEQLASLKIPSFRESENASMAAYEKMAATGQQFLKDAERRANLSKDQLSLEKQIADVQSRAQKAGATLTNKQAEDLAKLELDAERRRSQEGKSSEYDQLTANARQRIQDLQIEKTALGLTTEAAAAYRMEQELLLEAQRQGITLSPQQQEQIRALAAEYGKASAEVERTKDAQDRLNEAGSLAKGFFGDMVSSMQSGATAAEAFGDAIQNLLRKLLDMLADKAIMSLLEMLMSPSGGTLGTTTGASYVKAAKGGPVKLATGGAVRGPGSGTSDSVPAMLSDGEYVIRASQAKKHRALLDSINSGMRLPAFASGGAVGGGGARAGGMGGLNVQVVNNTGTAATGRVETQRGANGQLTVKVLLDAMRQELVSDAERLGPVSKAYQARWGLNPARGMTR